MCFGPLAFSPAVFSKQDSLSNELSSLARQSDNSSILGELENKNSTNSSEILNFYCKQQESLFRRIEGGVNSFVLSTPNDESIYPFSTSLNDEGISIGFSLVTYPHIFDSARMECLTFIFIGKNLTFTMGRIALRLGKAICQIILLTR